MLRRMSVPRRRNAVKASMFPHTVTLYTVLREMDGDFHETSVNHITVLRGVLLDEVKASNVRESGLEGADAATLYIPFSVEAADGLTRRPKRHVGPLEFWRAEDKSGLWTLSDGGNTFFIKNEVIEPEASVELIEMKYDSVFRVTKVDTKDFGTLKHWEAGGN